jgi:hypothetical protein
VRKLNIKKKTYRTTLRHIPEDNNFNIPCSEKLKVFVVVYFTMHLNFRFKIQKIHWGLSLVLMQSRRVYFVLMGVMMLFLWVSWCCSYGCHDAVLMGVMMLFLWVSWCCSYGCHGAVLMGVMMLFLWVSWRCSYGCHDAVLMGVMVMFLWVSWCCSYGCHDAVLMGVMMLLLQCFVWMSEQTAVISLNSINWLVFVREI